MSPGSEPAQRVHGQRTNATHWGLLIAVLPNRKNGLDDRGQLAPVASKLRA